MATKKGPSPDVFDADIPVRKGHGTLWERGFGKDPALYLVNPGTVTGPNQGTPGNLAHIRPSIACGQDIFVFPVGIEGFRRSGQATLGLHKYIGDDDIDGITIHRNEAHIELNGTLPGETAQPQMLHCLDIITRFPPDRGFVLYMPGLFENEQYVLPESWEFSHASDDRTHSIEYTISFVRIGQGNRVRDPRGKAPPPNPHVRIVPKGHPTKKFVTKDGARTLKQIAKSVYHDEKKWTKLVSINRGSLAGFQRGNALNIAHGLPAYKLPTYRWPVGTVFRY